MAMGAMKNPSKLLSSFKLLALCALLGSLSAAQDASSTIRAEIARLQQSLKSQPITDPDLKEINSMVGDGLKGAADALSSGQIYLSLERLGQAEDLIQGGRRADDKADVIKNGLPAFESEWGKVSLRLTALEQEAHNQSWDHTPAAVRAIAETAQRKAIPLLDGGRGFATATAPKDGLLYLGEAEGEAAFSKFCASLSFTGKAAPVSLRSLLPELQALQTKTNAAFQPPKSIDLHSRFISLNSAIKLAQELDASKFYAGALYTYLEAVRHYGMLDAAFLNAAQQSEVKQAIAEERKKLAASKRDDSIAQLYVERAESYTVHADGSAPSADEWRGARVVLDQVLPAYYGALKPASPLQRASGKTVDITLVRWPYT